MEKERNLKFLKIAISFVLFFVALFIKSDINRVLYLLAYILVGYEVIIKSFRHIVKGNVFDENFLMSIATIGAFAIGEYPEAVLVMLLYEIGESLEDYQVDKSRKEVEKLMNIKPDYANVWKDGKIEKTDPLSVSVGDIILVKPGEKVPLDGIVIEGESNLNTFALTGEVLPRKVMVGDSVLSGVINNTGTLKLKVVKEFSESTVSKILDLVENASSKKSKSENFITKFAKIYTPIVVVIALLLMIVPPLLISNTDFNTWVYRALSFLVVSCPCALVISIPLSFFCGIGTSSKFGVLIKGSNYLEALSKPSCIVCDKTGTLTEGVFKVRKVESKFLEREELLKYASFAEYFSTHPIAISLRDAYGKNIDSKNIKNTKEIPGMGTSSVVFSKKVLVGNEKLMEKYNISFERYDGVDTVVYVAIDNKYAGYITISDEVKKDSFKAVRKFREVGIKNIIMLTGDREDIAKDVSDKLEIKEYYANLLPQDKVSLLEKIMKKEKNRGNVIFIGDGINDAPVLSLADIGVAMGAIGSDAAVEASDVVIMTDELSRLAQSINISKKTMKIVRENIIFSISIKILVLLLSALGITNMWIAIFADVGVSLLAIMNATRVMMYKEK